MEVLASRWKNEGVRPRNAAALSRP
jgi:hypothetical protein